MIMLMVMIMIMIIVMSIISIIIIIIIVLLLLLLHLKQNKIAIGFKWNADHAAENKLLCEFMKRRLLKW